MHELLYKLMGDDRRSIGRSEEVAAAVLEDPGLFPVVFGGMLSDDPVLRMRCADAAEKITARRPELLRPHKAELIRRVAKIDQQEVRWHAAQMFSRLALNAAERRKVAAILQEYLKDESKIVKTFAMQALADIAEQDESLRGPLVEQLKKLTRSGSPAMKSRGRKLLARLAK